MLAETSTKFHDELNPGERIVWSGQPKQGFLLKPADALLIPFSLLWGAFAIFWEASVIAVAIEGKLPFPISIIFPLFGFPFVLIGLYMTFGRFFFDRAQRSKTYYALTNERAIILSGLRSHNVKSIDYKNLPEINISTKKDGPGTITFGSEPPPARFSWDFPGRSKYLASSFEMIEDARMVYQLVKRMQRED
jgi:hypothetical protein